LITLQNDVLDSSQLFLSWTGFLHVHALTNLVNPLLVRLTLSGTTQNSSIPPLINSTVTHATTIPPYMIDLFNCEYISCVFIYPNFCYRRFDSIAAAKFALRVSFQSTSNERSEYHG
uniref:Ovule protein n=1 Tax=Taenia asiatica TaxID=60517 RepID=A0A0R3W281_TAEAS